MKISKKLNLIAIGLLAAVALTIFFFGLGPLENFNLNEGALSHKSEIWVTDGGNLEIKETINIRVAGERVKYGIARALPKEYTNSRNHASPLQYKILETTRNGAPVERVTSKRSWGTRVQLWKGKKLLPKGDYEFSFRYRVFGQSLILPVGEEIRRYLTGKWLYPVLHTEAIIHLPKNINPKSVSFRAFIQQEIFAKDKEGKAKLVDTKKYPKDIQTSRPTPGTIHLETSRSLYPGEEVIFDLLLP